jgi:hypothetical protein
VNTGSGEVAADADAGALGGNGHGMNLFLVGCRSVGWVVGLADISR